MSRVLACAALLLLLCAAGGAGAALPRAGTLVPGTSLGGVRLGDTAGHVRATLGRSYGVCRGCARTTMYFTYRPFERRGLAVELTAGHVSAVYTLWQPSGWSAPGGVRLGAAEGEVTSLAGPLIPVACTGYSALVRDGRAARTAYYVVDGKLWGFGLLGRRQSPCR
jgi:hypothetical protein